MEIYNTQDVIDSRDVIERIEELEILIAGESKSDDFLEYTDEYDKLVSLKEECEQYSSEWKYGIALIHESYFEYYVQDLLSDIGVLPREIPWYIVIDWKKTADNIKIDYTDVDFDGETYYIRNS